MYNYSNGLFFNNREGDMNSKDKSVKLLLRDPAEVFRAELVASCGDPNFDGIFLQNLKRGDEVSFTTMAGKNDGFACHVKLRVVEPKDSTARIVLFKRFSGSYSEMIQVDPNSVVVVRGHRKGRPVEGWVGIATNVYLSGKSTFYFVKEVFINNQKIFPCSNTTRQ